MSGRQRIRKYRRDSRDHLGHQCGQIVLEGHIKHCVREGIEHGDADKTVEDFTKAVERFANMS
ncbi:hypothetical protein NE634_02655 [Lacrimispora saccharolytica]|nr:hypothetical protein [Lacrimispora saccharolytica]